VVSIETALKLAVLSNPEAFGLEGGDLNPLFMLVHREATGEDKEYEGEDMDTQVLDCFQTCSDILEAKVSELMKGVPPVKERPKTSKSSRSSKAPPSKKGAKITASQLKYIGFLMHELGKKPEYKEIKKLTQKEASAEIAKLEKHKKKENGE